MRQLRAVMGAEHLRSMVAILLSSDKRERETTHCTITHNILFEYPRVCGLLPAHHTVRLSHVLKQAVRLQRGTYSTVCPPVLRARGGPEPAAVCTVSSAFWASSRAFLHDFEPFRVIYDLVFE